jgi:hypothetical protein
MPVASRINATMVASKNNLRLHLSAHRRGKESEEKKHCKERTPLLVGSHKPGEIALLRLCCFSCCNGLA